MTKSTETIGIRDKLIEHTIINLVGMSSSETEALAHAAVVFLVIEDALGLDNRDELFDQLKDVADRVIEGMAG